MISIAENRFEDIPMYDSLRMQLSGPKVSDRGKYLEFEWYKILEWGDTAALHIAIYKWPCSFSWRDDFYWPRITMNYQWYYFLFPGGTSKFEDILPNQYKKKGIKFSDFILYHGQQKAIDDTIRFIVKQDRLFYFLQKGYFTIVEKNENFAIIDFYEPIVNIEHTHKSDITTTISAKVFINDLLEVLIVPYDIPIDLKIEK